MKHNIINKKFGIFLGIFFILTVTACVYTGVPVKDDIYKKIVSNYIPPVVDPNDSVDQLLEKAEEHYYFGDERDSLPFFQVAADRGDPFSSSILGFLYFKGRIGIIKDQFRAAKYGLRSFEKLSELSNKGNAKAQFYLGRMYHQGIFIESNPDKAKFLYEKAAAANLPMAKHNLSQMYEHGIGMEKDLAKAIDLLEQSAKQDLTRSMYSLAYHYRKGTGVDQNYAKAAELLKKPLQRANPQAENLLGVMYMTGQGVSVDKAKGIRMYQLSAEKGFAVAQDNLGWEYIWGNRQRGLDVDFEKGAIWLQKSAEQGYSNGQKNFGRAYEEGKGVTRNLTKAAEWYEKSAAQGNRSAKERLKKLLQ